MAKHHWIIMGCILLCFGQTDPSLLARGSRAEGSKFPALTRVDQIRALNPDEAKLGYPVHLRAVVTYYGGGGWELFVQDSTAGIYVNGPSKNLDLNEGDLVEINGVVAPGDFAPVITNVQIDRLGKASLPKARLFSLEDLRTGEEDGQWVEIEGLVRSTAVRNGRTSLDIGTSNGRIRAELPLTNTDLSRMVDAQVRLQGACGTIFNKKRQLIGVQLFVASPERITILQPAPEDPYASPVRPIGTLLQFTPQAARAHRVRVQGIVTLQRTGRSLFIRDDTEGLYVQTIQPTPLQIGDKVDVVGFPSAGDFSPILENAIFRRIGLGPAFAPVKVTAEQAHEGNFDAELVQIEGQLQEQISRPTEHVLILKAGNIVFESKLDAEDSVKNWPALKNQSSLSLTGICTVQVSEDRVPRAFRILLRSPDDVRVLKEPAWWNMGQVLSLAVLVATIALAAFAWVIILKGRVHEQTEIIRQRLEREGALEKRFQYVARATNDAVWDWDLASNTLWWNEGVQSIFGYRAEEIASDLSWWSDRLHPDDRDRTIASIQSTIDNRKENWSEEYRFRRADEAYAYVYDRGYLIRDESGKPIRMIGAMMDISERKRAERELHAAKVAAESANKAKSAFLANMSHEIRTPMNGILGTTELVLDTELNPEQREYLSMIKSSADCLLTVINDILDFSKIEAGKLDLDDTIFDLRRSLEETVKTFAFQTYGKGLELVCDIRPSVPDMVVGDPTRLRQIIVNLMGNAIKFTEQGEIVLQVEVLSKDENHTTLHFMIRDTGIGIPPEKRESIFKAFAQADGSTTRKYGGTGLGLTISSRLVEMMHGQIWVESELGKGSRFHFTAQFGTTEIAIRPEPAEIQNLNGVPVLIVDDNTTNQRILENMLAGWGMEVTVARNGVEALAELRDSESCGKIFSLIITDAHMPSIDGFALVESIRQSCQMPESTIMMLTSGGQRGDAAKCRELGVSAYLTKPILQSELRTAILKVLDQTHQGKPSSRLITTRSLAEEKPILRILLAEDNPVNQLLVTRLLAKRGHKVTVVSNGMECLESHKKEPFDLALMDVQMPGMDGLETTARIREHEAKTGNHLVIFALTAYAMAGDRERCLSAGMDDYLSKPVKAQELFEAIERHLPAGKRAVPAMTEV
jgi:PAS domain S-box-containing protein